MSVTRQIRLKSRPNGLPERANFELASVELAPPGAGGVQVKNLWMSVDPYMRRRMNDGAAHLPPFQLGKPLDGEAVGEIIASNDDAFAPGDIVRSNLGWREAFNAPAQAVRKLHPNGLPLQAFLGAAGLPGLTAYVGLLRIAALRDGDIVFVSAAAGAVGSMACQIAKAKGGRVIGSAGGPQKVAFLKSIGVDQVIDYKAERSLSAAIAAASPEGIDVYFDNVGGEHLEAALEAARPWGRIAICGAVSTYNDLATPPGPRNFLQIVGKQLRIQGFTVAVHMDLMANFHRDLRAWVAAGKVTWKETVYLGLERAPEAFVGLFTGENIGKMLVKLA